MNTFLGRVFMCLTLVFALASGVSPARAETVKNIVLVHGAFVDGSGWKPVYERLVRDGFKVTLVQQPLTALASDVAATQRVLALQDGATILVGHSYGGSIITEAGSDPHVVGLVYIAAHAPDAGETEAANGKKFPAAAKPPLETPDGYVYLDPNRFPSDFAADLPARQAQFEANAQMLTAAKAFTTPITNPAWKVKPSWYLIPTADRIINPELHRMYASRAHSHSVEVQGASHSVYESRPREVAALIEAAAQHALDAR